MDTRQNFGAFDIWNYLNRRIRWARLRNSYGKTEYVAPFEMIIDNHLVGYLCIAMLAYYHGTCDAMFMWWHAAAWLLVDSLVFMMMDLSVALPIQWQKNIFDWGRISNRPRGIYFFCFNLLEHYAMWITRECIGLYIRLKALQKTRVTWKEKEFQLEETKKDE